MSRTKKSGQGQAPPAQAQDQKPLRIFVKVGALKRFDALKRKTAELPVVISWDRRRGERREDAAAPENGRRAADRRQAPPFTWEMADFVVVEEPAPEPAPALAPAPAEKPPAARRTRRR